MTLDLQIRYNSYIGDGVTVEFPYTFRSFSSEDLNVSVEGELKTLGVDYTVSGVDVNAGGAVTFIVAPAALSYILIDSDVKIEQQSKYAEGGQFPAKTHERSLDRMVAMLQEMSETVQGVIYMPLGDTALKEIPAMPDRAGGYLGFDDDGNFTIMPTGEESAASASLSASEASASSAASAASAAEAAAYAASINPDTLSSTGSDLYLAINCNGF